jgi:hypothetical protein
MWHVEKWENNYFLGSLPYGLHFSYSVSLILLNDALVQMEKNRGLTPHRKKANKNPRKKYKLKHEKAVIRRKGQVRDIRQATTNYGGEASGIRTNISRSVRFKN